MKARQLLAIIVGAGTLVSCRGLCGQAGLPADNQQTTSQSFPVQGVVKELRPDGQTLIIAHEAIPGYMDAMTMPFKVRQPGALAKLQAGDRISFQFHVTEEQSWIDHISTLGVAQGGESRPTIPETAQPTRSRTRPPLMDYHFTNELGQAVSLSDFRGQALAITFFFTRCPVPDYCPRLSRNFEEASRKLLALTNAPANWHFLSFSFDPQFDTPGRLKAYGERYDYDPQHWSFLTGPPDKIAELAAQSDVTFSPENGFYSHNFRTLIIDAAGHLQMAFPVGGNLTDAIVTEMLKAAVATNAPAALASRIQPPAALDESLNRPVVSSSLTPRPQ